eukprot:jgi/Bigna1/69275/fgenesh1_pg.8_\
MLMVAGTRSHHSGVPNDARAVALAAAESLVFSGDIHGAVEVLLEAKDPSLEMQACALAGSLAEADPAFIRSTLYAVGARRVGRGELSIGVQLMSAVGAAYEACLHLQLFAVFLMLQQLRYTLLAVQCFDKLVEQLASENRIIDAFLLLMTATLHHHYFYCNDEDEGGHHGVGGRDGLRHIYPEDKQENAASEIARKPAATYPTRETVTPGMGANATTSLILPVDANVASDVCRQCSKELNNLGLAGISSCVLDEIGKYLNLGKSISNKHGSDDDGVLVTPTNAATAAATTKGYRQTQNAPPTAPQKPPPPRPSLERRRSSRGEA